MYVLKTKVLALSSALRHHQSRSFFDYLNQRAVVQPHTVMLRKRAVSAGPLILWCFIERCKCIKKYECQIIMHKVKDYNFGWPVSSLETYGRFLQKNMQSLYFMFFSSSYKQCNTSVKTPLNQLRIRPDVQVHVHSFTWGRRWKFELQLTVIFQISGVVGILLWACISVDNHSWRVSMQRPQRLLL